LTKIEIPDSLRLEVNVMSKKKIPDWLEVHMDRIHSLLTKYKDMGLITYFSTLIEWTENEPYKTMVTPPANLPAFMNVVSIEVNESLRFYAYIYELAAYLAFFSGDTITLFDKSYRDGGTLLVGRNTPVHIFTQENMAGSKYMEVVLTDHNLNQYSIPFGNIEEIEKVLDKLE